MRFTLRRVAAAAGVVALSLALGGTAQADPVTAPDAAGNSGSDFVGTGSDTSMFVTDLVADAWSTQTPAPARLAASFDACTPGVSPPQCGVGQIQIRPTPGPDGVAGTADDSITRPNGSSAGITTLCNNPAVDFARSSREQNASACDQSLTFVNVLIDPLSYIFDNTMPLTSPLRTLDATELNDVYDDCDLDVNNGVPLTTPILVDVKLPQAGSGTRAFFLGAIGHTEVPKSFGACVVDTVQEHDATPVDGDNNAIAPFSGARFANNPTGGTVPATIVRIASTGTTPNTFYVERDLHLVWRNTDLADPQKGADINTFLDFVCDFYSTESNRQGFLPHPDCA